LTTVAQAYLHFPLLTDTNDILGGLSSITINGNVSFSSVSGFTGCYFSNTGGGPQTNRVYTVSNTAFSSMVGWSVSCWFYLPVFPSQFYSAIWSIGNTNNPINLYVDTVGNFYMVWYTLGNVQYTIGSGKVQVNQWYNAVVTFSNNGPVTVYLNGTNVGSMTNSNLGYLNGTSYVFTLAGDTRSGISVFGFNGWIANTIIYNSVLSTSDVTILSKGLSYLPLLVYLPFNSSITDVAGGSTVYCLNSTWYTSNNTTTAAIAPVYTIGLFDNAINLTNAFILASMSPLSSWTCTLRMYSTQGGDALCITGTGVQIYIQVQTTGTFNVFNNIVTQSFYIGTTYIMNKWTDIAISYNNSNATLQVYLNGSLVSTSTVTTLLPVVNTIYIGQQVPSYEWRGFYDECRMYNTVLTSSQIASMLVTYTPLNGITISTNGATGTSGPTSLLVPNSSITLSNGIQIWKVPTTQTYYITAAGGKGGSSQDGYLGGSGIIVSSYIPLNQNDLVYILVGQKGLNGTYVNSTALSGGGGGGGTYVVKYLGGTTTSASSYKVLLVAGGGAGGVSGFIPISIMNGSPVTGGYNDTSGGFGGGGGINVNGGTNSLVNGAYNAPYGGSGAGAGFLTNGETGANTSAGAIGGTSFLNGGAGGAGCSSCGGYGNGGFGGGGGGGVNSTWGGGGGGGYSGGGGNSQYYGGSGGGGGSYDTNGINNIPSSLGFNAGDGYVLISTLTAYQIQPISPSFSPLVLSQGISNVYTSNYMQNVTVTLTVVPFPNGTAPYAYSWSTVNNASTVTGMYGTTTSTLNAVINWGTLNTVTTTCIITDATGLTATQTFTNWPTQISSSLSISPSASVFPGTNTSVLFTSNAAAPNGGNYNICNFFSSANGQYLLVPQSYSPNQTYWFNYNGNTNPTAWTKTVNGTGQSLTGCWVSPTGQYQVLFGYGYYPMYSSTYGSSSNINTGLTTTTGSYGGVCSSSYTCQYFMIVLSGSVYYTVAGNVASGGTPSFTLLANGSVSSNGLPITSGYCSGAVSGATGQYAVISSGYDSVSWRAATLYYSSNANSTISTISFTAIPFANFSPPNTGPIYSTAISADGSVIAVGGLQGLWISYNGNKPNPTFTQVSTLTLPGTFSLSMSYNAQVIVYSTTGNFYVSLNGGNSFVTYTLPANIYGSGTPSTTVNVSPFGNLLIVGVGYGLSLGSIGYFFTISSVSASLVSSGLIAGIDASNLSSYTGTGITITDLSSANGPTTISGPWNYTSNGQASYWWNTNGPACSLLNSLYQNYLDFCLVFYVDLTFIPTGQGIVDIICANNGNPYTLRFTSTGSQWYMTNPDNSNGWSYPSATTFYLNGQAITGQVTISSSGWYILGGGRTNTTSGYFASPWQYSIGSNSAGGASRSYQGKIGALYMYNRILSAAEQQQNYLVMKARFSL